MKTGKHHIFRSWLLLLCFVAGQYMVYAHQHNIIKRTVKTYDVARTPAGKTFTERCALCDAMHHTVMLISHNVYFNPITVTGHFFEQVSYKFISFQLIQAGGRAPPISTYSV